MRRAPLVLLVAALAGCGGSGDSKKSSGPELTPVAFVKTSAAKTAKATSEHLSLKGSVTVNGQTVTLGGNGDFDNVKRTGNLHIDFNAGGLAGTIDEVIDGTVVYMKSPLFADAVPKGKTWIKIDLQKAGATKGIDFSTLGSQDPTQTLAQLQGMQNVTKVGDETIDGTDTVHYRGTLDLSKVPQAEKIKSLADGVFGPYDVWIGKDDGYVRRVRFSLTTSGQKIALTSDFSDFGKDVSIDVPSAADTYDATNKALTGLGG